MLSGTGVATGAAVGSSNLTAVVAGITSSPALTLGVTSTNTLVNAYLSGAGSCVPSATIQFAAKCHYSTGADQDCTVTDVHGDAVTGWSSSSSSLVSVENVGAVNPGLASCVAVGSASITATINGTLVSSGSTVTVSSPSVTLTGVSLATTGGVTGLLVGSTNQLTATCTYSDGSSDLCTNTDAHGNVATTWTSTTPGHASVNATSGLATGVAPGATTFTAVAGSFTSPAIPVTVMAIPSGVYTITITGPVTITGTVHF
jgi:trimeric autotransporter adhesin